MDWVANANIWIGLATLTALEIVLGVDNVIFISILAGKLPVEQQAQARRVGLGLAMLLPVMIAAVVIAVGIMMLAAGAINDFVSRHPTVKMLALSFLLLIGMSLLAEGFDQHIPKGYIYFAMAFSVFVELLNLWVRRGPSEPVQLHEPYVADEGGRGAMPPSGQATARKT